MTPLIIVVAACTLGADQDQQSALLQTFRSEFVEITPGTGKFPASFEMGTREESAAERPVHTVTLKDSFSVAKFEVPQNLWSAVMGGNPSRWKGPRNSVEMVSHPEAVKFCEKATEQMRAANLIAEDQVIRLPTEAEWEYVTRAGTSTSYSFGDDAEALDQYGWHTGNAAGNDPPVGAKKPNPWGLYDVHGYLWEWCADAAQPNYRDTPRDGTAYHSDSPRRRVIRGGSWKDPATSLTSTCRHGRLRHTTADGETKVIEFTGGIDATIRDDAIGFRCVLSRANTDDS